MADPLAAPAASSADAATFGAASATSRSASPGRRRTPDRLRTYVAVMLALLGVLGALVAWRIAVATSVASDTTRSALLERERTGTAEVGAAVSALEGYAAWLDYETARYRGVGLFNRSSEAESLRAFGEAAGHWFMVPDEFMDRDGNFDPGAYEASLVAAATQGRTSPEELLARADAAEAWAAALGRAAIVLALALPLLTAAEVVHRRARPLLAVAGTVVTGAGILLLLAAWG